MKTGMLTQHFLTYVAHTSIQTSATLPNYVRCVVKGSLINLPVMDTLSVPQKDPSSNEKLPCRSKCSLLFLSSAVMLSFNISRHHMSLRPD